MVEEWKKAAEVSREVEYKPLEYSPLNILLHVSLPLKDQLSIVFFLSQKSAEKMYILHTRSCF